jgi:hypothetical protein
METGLVILAFINGMLAVAFIVHLAQHRETEKHLSRRIAELHNLTNLDDYRHADHSSIA